MRSNTAISTGIIGIVQRRLPANAPFAWRVDLSGRAEQTCDSDTFQISAKVKNRLDVLLGKYRVPAFLTLQAIFNCYI
nr:hypothetical protein [Mucilaginibacter sp. 21P]